MVHCLELVKAVLSCLLTLNTICRTETSCPASLGNSLNLCFSKISITADNKYQSYLNLTVADKTWQKQFNLKICLIAVLMNKVVPCTWFLSGVLEVWRLRLQLILQRTWLEENYLVQNCKFLSH